MLWVTRAVEVSPAEVVTRIAGFCSTFLDCLAEWGFGRMRGMRICMDYQPAVAQCAGIGRYTRVLASEMARLLSREDTLSLFYCDFRRKSNALEIAGAETVAFRALPGAVMQKLWHYAGFPPFNWIAGDADVYHFTNFTTKPLTQGKSVVSVHDMSFERFPQFAEKRNLSYLRAGIRRSVQSADAIITISEFSKGEIETLLPESRGKVSVTHLGIGSEFSIASREEVETVKKRFGLTRPYLMTVGTIEPRKNLEFLVDVFEKVAGQGIDLVIAGAPGWKCEAILKRFENTKYKDQLHYLRFIPDGCLPCLYSAASLFVIPSHYEGFGFAPLEAMACGTPVLSSSGGSLPEVLGNAACILDTFEVDAWAHEVVGIIQNPVRSAEMVQRGILCVSRYSWHHTAVQTLDVYKKVLGL